MNITITGNLGSGKTSVCNILREKGLEIISAGAIFREVADEKGLSIVELNELAKKDRSVDDLVDARSEKLGREKDGAVFDSRLAWHFAGESFKVFLCVSADEAAKRVYHDAVRNAETYASVEEAREGLNERASLEKRRFQDLYGINYYDAGNYDLIIETTAASPEAIAEEILKELDLYEKEKFPTRVKLNPESVLPAAELTEKDKSLLERIIREEKETGRSRRISARIFERDGYLIASGLDGGESICRVLAAAALGCPFVEASFTAPEEGAPLSKEAYEAAEGLGGFHYRSTPAEKPISSQYSLEFDHLF